MLQYFHCFCIRKILWSEVGKSNKKGLLKLWYTVLFKMPIDWVFKQLKQYEKKSRNSTPNKIITLTYTSIGKLYYKHPLKERYGMPKEWFLRPQKFIFEGRELVGLETYDEYLKFSYGDYMKLPPEDQREQHAPVSDYSI